MLILQPPANTDDLHLRPSPLGVCLCMCAWCWWVCVRLWGLTDEATGGPATRVCVCVFVCSMGDGRNDFILCASVYVCMWVQARVELSLKDAGRVTGPFSLASTFRRGAQILNWMICHLFTVHGARASEISLAVFSFLLKTDTSGCKHPPIFLSSPGALFQCITLFLYKIRRQIITSQSLYW